MTRVRPSAELSLAAFVESGTAYRESRKHAFKSAFAACDYGRALVEATELASVARRSGTSRSAIEVAESELLIGCCLIEMSRPSSAARHLRRAIRAADAARGGEFPACRLEAEASSLLEGLSVTGSSCASAGLQSLSTNR